MKACHNSTISESLRPRAVTGASQSDFNSFSREGGAKEPQTSTNQSAVSSQAAPITAGNQITCQTTSLGASSMNMLTPQSSCSSGYPSPIIRKENMLSFHVTPLLQSLWVQLFCPLKPSKVLGKFSSQSFSFHIRKLTFWTGSKSVISHLVEKVPKFWIIFQV